MCGGRTGRCVSGELAGRVWGREWIGGGTVLGAVTRNARFGVRGPGRAGCGRSRARRRSGPCSL